MQRTTARLASALLQAGKASIWHIVKQLDPTFDYKEYGRGMVKALEPFAEIREGDSAQMICLRSPGAS